MITDLHGKPIRRRRRAGKGRRQRRTGRGRATHISAAGGIACTGGGDRDGRTLPRRETGHSNEASIADTHRSRGGCSCIGVITVVITDLHGKPIRRRRRAGKGRRQRRTGRGRATHISAAAGIACT